MQKDSGRQDFGEPQDDSRQNERDSAFAGRGRSATKLGEDGRKDFRRTEPSSTYRQFSVAHQGEHEYRTRVHLPIRVVSEPTADYA